MAFFIIIPIDHDENWLIDIKKLILAKIKRKISIKSKRSHVKVDSVMKKAICTKIKFRKENKIVKKKILFYLFVSLSLPTVS